MLPSGPELPRWLYTHALPCNATSLPVLGFATVRCLEKNQKNILPNGGTFDSWSFTMVKGKKSTNKIQIQVTHPSKGIVFRWFAPKLKARRRWLSVASCHGASLLVTLAEDGPKNYVILYPGVGPPLNGRK